MSICSVFELQGKILIVSKVHGIRFDERYLQLGQLFHVTENVTRFITFVAIGGSKEGRVSS